MKIISFWMEKKTWNTLLKHRTSISTHTLTHLLLTHKRDERFNRGFSKLKNVFENIVLIDEEYLFLNEKHEARFSNISFWMDKHETRFKPTIELPNVGPTRQRGPAREPRAQLGTLHAPTSAVPAPPHKHYGLLTLTLHNWKTESFFSLNSLGGHH